MKNAIVCFADNRNDVEIAFRDYMSHYLTETEHREGYVYDKSVSFAEKEAKIDKLMMSEISKLSGLNLADSTITPEAMSTNPVMRWASMAVVNSMIDMIVPDVLDRSIGEYTEQRYADFGDSFSFTVESNDLFYVSKAGRDMRTTEFQKAFAGQTTVVPENRALTVHVNFYRVLCKKESLAKFVMKAILSLESQITKEVFIAFDTAMSEIPTTTEDDNLHVVGWSQDSAVRLAQTVSAYNNGAEAIFLGTKLALSKVLPANSNYRYDIDSPYVRVGYIRDFMGCAALEMKQVADWNNPHKLLLNDNRIYVISAATSKPVKLCYEGASHTNNMDFIDSADMTATTTIQKSYGIGISTNALVGLIDLV